MNLWKRILHGVAVALGSTLVIVVGAMLPPEVVPPISTLVALIVLPVLVGGGSSILRIRHRYLAEAALPVAILHGASVSGALGQSALADVSADLDRPVPDRI